MARPTGDRAKGEAACLALITQLSNKPGWTYCRAKNPFLARRLGKSVRTVCRYISSLIKQGKLQATYRRRKGVNGFTTSRYCRPITEECPRTWAPSAFCTRAVISKPVESEVKKVVVQEKTSWVKPYIEGQDRPQYLLIQAAAEAAAKADEAMKLKRQVNPAAKAEADLRFWTAEAAIANGDKNYYRRFNK